jgi:hypothetical protein
LLDHHVDLDLDQVEPARMLEEEVTLERATRMELREIGKLAETGSLE